MPDYGWKDDFIARPAPGAVETDLTQATLTIDIKNSMDEHFRFDIPPETTLEQAKRMMAPRANGVIGKDEHKVYLEMHYPLSWPVSQPYLL